MPRAGRRVLITGIGVVCAIAPDAPSYFRALRAAACGIRRMTLYPADGFRSPLAAEVPDAVLPPGMPEAIGDKLSRTDVLGVRAAAEALADAGFPPPTGIGDPARFGSVLGGSTGGMSLAERFHRRRLLGGPDDAPLSQILSYQISSTSDVVACLFGLEGPRLTVMTACSSGSGAIGLAADLIRSGRADRMITGGVDGLCELTLAGFNALHVVDASACRPFDRARGGLNLGEGAGVLVLESEESAVARGARVRGEVLGYAVTSDAHHMTAPHPDGAGAARAIAGALAAAGVRPEDVDCINAHGTGTPHNDVAETRAIRAVFGGLADRIPVCATKSLIGHALGAAGGLEAIAALHAIAENFIHPTLRLTDPDPECDLRHVIGDGLAARVDVVLSNSFGFGGNNCALVLGRAR